MVVQDPRDTHLTIVDSFLHILRNWVILNSLHGGLCSYVVVRE